VQEEESVAQDYNQVSQELLHIMQVAVEVVHMLQMAPPAE
jgi:hypothetical protein